MASPDKFNYPRTPKQYTNQEPPRERSHSTSRNQLRSYEEESSFYKSEKSYRSSRDHNHSHYYHHQHHSRPHPRNYNDKNSNISHYHESHSYRSSDWNRSSQRHSNTHHSRHHQNGRKDSKRDYNSRHRNDQSRNPYSSRRKNLERERNRSRERERESYFKYSDSQKKSEEYKHFKYKKGNYIKNYKILDCYGDGTFGRVLKCLNTNTNEIVACKVIKSVKRYIKAAEVEASIIEKVQNQDVKKVSKIVKLHEYFTFHNSHQHKFFCMVFEPLGPSLYDVIKKNNYKGFSLRLIKSFAFQIFQSLNFLHNIGLTHTDLKPENILLKSNDYYKIKDPKKWPKQIINQNEYEKTSRSQYQTYFEPMRDEIKLIDFGGATFSADYHTKIINTRQYRAPEVILRTHRIIVQHFFSECKQWSEKSDIWSTACILVELYTGELFFPTHQNYEHLVLMEKAFGPFPQWMANLAQKEMRSLFDLENTAETIKVKMESLKNFPFAFNFFLFLVIDKGMRIQFPSKSVDKDVIDNVNEFKKLDDIILEEHKEFKDFLNFLFVQDPEKRPSSAEVLKHKFFQQIYEDEVQCPRKINDYKNRQSTSVSDYN